MIRFENVVKKYPGTMNSAVNQLNLHIKKGEICMLVGPSGCGKTTTLKMINRLIEPTSGKIYVNDQDISKIDPIQLRLNIGYVIQDIGLFPHMTIEENIATVPLEKGWDRGKINERIDELLNLVELKPEVYRKKRPTALSGGQKQRVGVARALAGDPEIMLMDEPFAALDPITRKKLQNEFLRIQSKLHKTIVFVTHDIDEAMKMGDKIAVMRGGNLVQYGTPHEILKDPANEFVENLIGGNSPLKMMNLITCREIMRDVPLIQLDDNKENLLKLNRKKEMSVAVVMDHNRNVIGYVEYADLVKNKWNIHKSLRNIGDMVEPDMTLHDVLSEMFSTGSKYIFISNEKGKVAGVLGMDDLMKAVNEDEQPKAFFA